MRASQGCSTPSSVRCRRSKAGPHGVRVLTLWTAGVVETFGLPDDSTGRSLTSIAAV